jgi:hypothetical protein
MVNANHRFLAMCRIEFYLQLASQEARKSGMSLSLSLSHFFSFFQVVNGPAIAEVWQISLTSMETIIELFSSSSFFDVRMCLNSEGFGSAKHTSGIRCSNEKRKCSESEEELQKLFVLKVELGELVGNLKKKIYLQFTTWPVIECPPPPKRRPLMRPESRSGAEGKHITVWPPQTP